MQDSKAPKEQIANDETVMRMKVRTLNDALRAEGRGGKIVMTLGVHGLEAKRKQRVLDAVRSYDTFTADNDPFGEHDFGEVEIDGQAIMFKIDYYDVSGRNHSPDPSDPAVTRRIMTLMLSDEY